MELTSAQEIRVKQARERLAESQAVKSVGEGDAIRLWGGLEHHVESLLAIIDELTGAGNQ